MKTLVAILSALALVLGLSACTVEPKPTNNKPALSQVTPKGKPLDPPTVVTAPKVTLASDHTFVQVIKAIKPKPQAKPKAQAQALPLAIPALPDIPWKEVRKLAPAIVAQALPALALPAQLPKVLPFKAQALPAPVRAQALPKVQPPPKPSAKRQPATQPRPAPTAQPKPTVSPKPTAQDKDHKHSKPRDKSDRNKDRKHTKNSYRKHVDRDGRCME